MDCPTGSMTIYAKDVRDDSTGGASPLCVCRSFQNNLTTYRMLSKLRPPSSLCAADLETSHVRSLCHCHVIHIYVMISFPFGQDFFVCAALSTGVSSFLSGSGFASQASQGFTQLSVCLYISSPPPPDHSIPPFWWCSLCWLHV